MSQIVSKIGIICVGEKEKEEEEEEEIEKFTSPTPPTKKLV